MDYLKEFLLLLEDFVNRNMNGYKFCRRYGSLRATYFNIAENHEDLWKKQSVLLRDLFSNTGSKSKIKKELDDIQREMYKGNSLDPLSREHNILIDKMVSAVDRFDPPGGYPDPLDEDGFRLYIAEAFEELKALQEGKEFG